MRYRSLSDAMKERFGTKVYRLALTTGATCPNRDGTLGYGGCIFCSEGGSGEFAAPLLPVKEQIRQAKKRVSAKFSPSIPEEERKYIAYFQSFTNTYGDEDTLLSEQTRPVFEQHYPGMSHAFPGGHRMNDYIVTHTLLPYIRGLNII